MCIVHTSRHTSFWYRLSGRIRFPVFSGDWSCLSSELVSGLPSGRVIGSPINQEARYDLFPPSTPPPYPSDGMDRLRPIRPVRRPSLPDTSTDGDLSSGSGDRHHLVSSRKTITPLRENIGSPETCFPARETF